MKAPKRTPNWRKLRTILLAERLHLLGHLFARQDAECFNQTKGDAAHGTFESFGLIELDQRLDHLGDVAIDEFLQARLHRFAVGSVQLIVGDDVDAGFQWRGAGAQPCDRRAVPADAAVAREDQIRIGRGGDRLGARGNFRRDRRHRCRLQCAAMHFTRGAVGDELKALDAADIFALHMNRAIFLDCRHQLILLRQAFHQHAGAAVDKTRCQPFMQGVG